MNELVVVGDSCPVHGAALAPGCGACPGRDVPSIPPPPSAMAPAPRQAVLYLPPEVAAWLDNRWIVVGLLLAAGPMGLPALWLSRRFSRWTKIATTALFFLATAVLPLVATWYFCEVSLRPLVDVLSAAHQAR